MIGLVSISFHFHHPILLSASISVVYFTKNASPAFPNFINKSVFSPFTSTVTTFSADHSIFILPNLTWKGLDNKVPSSYCTTMISMPPLRVAWLRSKGQILLKMDFILDIRILMINLASVSGKTVRVL